MNIVKGAKFGKWTVIDDETYYIGAHKATAVKCECGNSLRIRTASLKNGTSTQCQHCRSRAHGDNLKIEGSGWNTFFYRYKSNANNRGLEWPLSLEEFRYYAEKDCWYCGQKPETRILSRSQTIEANGIDRKDSSLGYVFGNMVTCCGTCNKMKMGLNEKQFLDRARLISRKHEII